MPLAPPLQSHPPSLSQDKIQLPSHCPGLCRAKGGSLAAASTTSVPPCQPSAAHLGSPRPHGLPGCSWCLWRGHAAPLPLSSCRNRALTSHTIWCTDFVLLSLSGAAWSLPQRGLGKARSLYWILIILLSGVGEKINF